MATSGSVFSETLQEITNTKLDELSKRRSSFEEAKSSLLLTVKAEGDAVKRLTALKEGVKKCFGIKVNKAGMILTGHTRMEGLEIELKNIDRFIEQAKYDPSLSTEMLQTWEQTLLRRLEMQSLKFQYASLYGRLVTEWLSGDKTEKPPVVEDVEMGDAFEDLGNAKKLETRMEWEKVVFEPAKVSEPALKKYLNRLFEAGNDDKQDTEQALASLRDAVYAFETHMSTPNQFDVTSLKWAIQGLHSSSLLSDEKREVLKDFEDNTIILKEIADVLNMRIGSLDTWTWSSDAPVPLEMRRTISGVYNIHMHEDLLQAIFLQYIGVKWSVFFKGAFKQFRQSHGAWKSTSDNIPNLDKLRAGYYLGEMNPTCCLQFVRNSMHERNYFMAQLMDNEQQNFALADGEEEAEFEQASSESRKRKAANLQQFKRNRIAAQMPPLPRQTPAIVHRSRDRITQNEDESRDPPPNPIQRKQTLLHLLSTEAAINTRLYGEMTAFHSVFESWNPLLPHQTACIILEYFGVSETWLEFFRRFLEAPLRFMEDGPSAPARRRLRGTPSAHVLSDVFGESTLFCLDLAINHATSGNNLWRVHDDFWFWSPDHSVAVKAWETVIDFAAVTGTQVNEAKSGSIKVSKNNERKLPIHQKLPDGEIRWGFLRLSPDTGRFEIDQTMVDNHIKELQRQLGDKKKSILDFIQTWNSYAATFFTSNFGKSANCFGQQHVDNMLATHQRIQEQVFSTLAEDGEGNAASVVDFLKKAIGQRFGIDQVPDGYLYFPMELGGLDLQSPFISLLQIRENVLKSPSDLLESFEEAERTAYEDAKEAFLNGTVTQFWDGLAKPDWVPESAQDRKTFMSFEEYVRHREHFEFQHQPTDQTLEFIFNQLMRRPTETSIDLDNGKVGMSLSQLQGQSNVRGITGYFAGMEPYWRWVAMMYGPEIVDRFGGLNIVDPGLLPMGMVTLFRDKRVKWDG